MSLFTRKQQYDREALYAAAERAAAEAQALSAEVKELVRQRRAEPVSDVTKRISKRIKLWAAGKDLVDHMGEVQVDGTVSVPGFLLLNLREAVMAYHPSDSSDREQRIRTYAAGDGWRQPE